MRKIIFNLLPQESQYPNVRKSNQEFNIVSVYNSGNTSFKEELLAKIVTLPEYLRLNK